MKKIDVKKITEALIRLSEQANCMLPEDIWRSLKTAYQKENSDISRGVISQILENAETALNKGIALCQDTGTAEVFIRLGQDVHLTGGKLTDAVNKGISVGYWRGYLRKSIVKDPFDRVNTNDNTPAQIHIEVVEGDKIEILLLPKGGGSENTSALKMFTPSTKWEEIEDFIIKTVKNGINSCPPLIVGIGIGGSFSSVALLAKKALFREVGTYHGDDEYNKKEIELLNKINKMKIGPMGLGGAITALAVHIKTAPCHIASLPVAVNIQCHSSRRMKETI